MNSKSLVNCFVWNNIFDKFANFFFGGMPPHPKFVVHRAPLVIVPLLTNLPFKVIQRRVFPDVWLWNENAALFKRFYENSCKWVCPPHTRLFLYLPPPPPLLTSWCLHWCTLITIIIIFWWSELFPHKFHFYEKSMCVCVCVSVCVYASVCVCVCVCVC